MAAITARAGICIARLILPLFLLFSFSFTPEYPNGADECEVLQARLKRLTPELAACRKALKTAQEDLAYCNTQIDMYIVQILKQETARDLVEKGSLEYKAFVRSIEDAKKFQANFERKRIDSKKIVTEQTANEKILLLDFHRTRDRIDAECGGVKKDPPLPVIPDVKGNYNSPYGNTIMIQEKINGVTFLTATVHYSDEQGGSSNLRGSFDGSKWDYTWRNSFSHYGRGSMIYNKEDGSFKGYWVDEYVKPSNKGNWWLRPK